MTLPPMVWIDCGHGGHDSGSASWSGFPGTAEKHVVLAQGLALRTRLEAAGLRVGMSRREDVFIPLADRAAMANAAGATIFVSLHCNAENREAQGTETYHFRGSVRGRELARAIHARMRRALFELRDRGVKGAGYLVLRDTKMPAVLGEPLFLDERLGEKLAAERKEQIVEAYAAGILDYLNAADAGPVMVKTPAGMQVEEAVANPAVEPHPVRREFWRMVYRIAEALIMRSLTR